MGRTFAAVGSGFVRLRHCDGTFIIYYFSHLGFVVQSRSHCDAAKIYGESPIFAYCDLSLGAATASLHDGIGMTGIENYVQVLLFL